MMNVWIFSSSRTDEEGQLPSPGEDVWTLNSRYLFVEKIVCSHGRIGQSIGASNKTYIAQLVQRIP